MKNGITNSENTYNTPLSRARAYAHYRIFVFFCHKCHRIVCNLLKYSLLSLNWNVI